MNDADVFHLPRRPSRGQRLIAAWRGLAQLGMLLDGRAHIWSGEAAGGKREPNAFPVKGPRPGAPPLARLAA